MTLNGSHIALGVVLVVPNWNYRNHSSKHV